MTRFGPKRYFVAVASALGFLFALLAPGDSSALDAPSRLLYWLTLSFTALAAAVSAQPWVDHIARRFRLWPLAALAATGAIAALPTALIDIAASAALGVVEDAPRGVERWLAPLGPFGRLLSEWGDIAPPLAVLWCLLNAPFRDAQAQGASDGGAASGDAGEDGGAAGGGAEPLEPRPKEPAPARERSDVLPLPPALGRDVVRLEAELHYVRVVTTRGETLILSSLTDAIAAVGRPGFRSHRSHWVAFAHVRGVERAGSGHSITLTNGAAPLGRRRRQAFDKALAAHGTPAAQDAPPMRKTRPRCDDGPMNQGRTVAKSSSRRGGRRDVTTERHG